MFQVISKGQAVALSAQQLAEMLIAKSISEKAKRQQEAAIPLALAIAKELEAKGLLRDTNPLKLLALGIGVGYYLNTFFRNNEVEIQEQQDAIKNTVGVDRQAPANTSNSD